MKAPLKRKRTWMSRIIMILLIWVITVGWVIPEDLPKKEYPQMPASLARMWTGLPTSFDWRDTGFVTPVKNQGSCGSCWAFASLAPMEFRLSQMGKKYTDLSEQIILNYSGAGDCSGGYMSYTANFLTSTGDTIESCLPYNGGYQDHQGACQNWELNSYRYSSWNYVYPVADPQTVKDAIYEFGPVSCVFALYRDFDSYHSGIYVHDGVSSFRGYHAVSCLGWDDTGEYLICKNSWGTSWGESGFFRVAYNQVNDPRVRFCYQIFYYEDASFAYPAKSQISTTSDVEGFAPYEVELTSGSTGTIDSLLWDLGDGETSTEPAVTHIFQSPDIYEVKLLVTNDIDGSDETSMIFHVNPPPDPKVQDKSGGGGGGCFISVLQLDIEDKG